MKIKILKLSKKSAHYSARKAYSLIGVVGEVREKSKYADCTYFNLINCEGIQMLDGSELPDGANYLNVFVSKYEVVEE